jgi:protein required for attachment to host cells
MDTTWIMAADSSRARIFERLEHERNLRELLDFVNPSGRADATDLRSDERGRFYGKGERYQGHTADPQVDPVQHESELFARDVAGHLNKAYGEQRYQRLVLVAAPKFLGLVRGKLHKDVQQAVVEELPKDISGFNLHQVEAYLRERIDKR